MNLGSTNQKASNLREPATQVESPISSLISVSPIENKKTNPEFYFEERMERFIKGMKRQKYKKKKKGTLK